MVVPRSNGGANQLARPAAKVQNVESRVIAATCIEKRTDLRRHDRKVIRETAEPGEQLRLGCAPLEDRPRGRRIGHFHSRTLTDGAAPVAQARVVELRSSSGLRAALLEVDQSDCAASAFEKPASELRRHTGVCKN